jgi:hypothetical protein
MQVLLIRRGLGKASIVISDERRQQSVSFGQSADPVAPAFAGRARACGRPISGPLEFTGGLPGDGTGVFRSPVEARQEARVRTSRRAGTEPSGNRATGDPASRSPAAAIASDIASTVLLALRRAFSARLQYSIMSFK